MKTKSKTLGEAMNGIAPPPWHKLTRENAWRTGWNAGYQEGKEKARLESEQKGIQLNREIEAARRSALKDICQAGSSVVEGMTKALLNEYRSGSNSPDFFKLEEDDYELHVYEP